MDCLKMWRNNDEISWKKRNKKENKPTVKKEEYAVVLDYLSRGYVKSDMSKFGGKPIAQAIGTDYFTLLELAPKKGVERRHLPSQDEQRR